LLTKRRSRSGISSLIGAIFFVLVVFLVFSSTVLIFQTFTGYATTFKQVNQGDLNNKKTSLTIQDLAFGGLATTSAQENLGAVPNSANENYLPVQNMNFTNSMNGWTFSRGYELSLHNGQVTNYPENVLPGLDVFTMVITNLDTNPPYAFGTIITSVTLIVNSQWRVPVATQVTPPLEGADWTVSVAANTITWQAINAAPVCTNGVPTVPPGASDSLLFTWSAVVPPVSGQYLHDITLTWETYSAAPGMCNPAKDQGTATITTNAVPSNQGGVDTAQIASEPSGTIPGGSFGGFDAVSTNIGSESGPGSVYLSFQPTFNGEPITTTTQGSNVLPEQLTSEMNFTTYFNLDSPLVLASEPVTGCSIIKTGCPVLSFGYSLDHAVSGEPPLIVMNGYLIHGASVKQIINATALNLSNNGWLMNDTAFSLGPATLATSLNSLPAGQYELVISVVATMFGTNPPSANYPASLLMHFDDIGLAIHEAAGSFCVDTAAGVGKPCTQTAPPCPSSPLSCGLFTTISPVRPSQIQSLKFDAQLSVSSPGSEVTAYAYLENIQASPTTPAWTEVGQVTFTSSASIEVNLPASSASTYLDEYGGLCSSTTAVDPAGSACIRVYAISSADFGVLRVNASMVVQTFQQQQSTLLVLNNGTAPVHIVSVYISGTAGPYGNDTSLKLPLGPGPSPGEGIWVSPGQVTAIQVGLGTNNECNSAVAGSQPTSLKCFVWTTGQTYVVTVTTDKGLVFTQTYVSP
jgi:hypothetical protein